MADIDDDDAFEGE